ncbi:hypothetical protein ACVWYG_001472 [Pedobacter sp. UYEF25]
MAPSKRFWITTFMFIILFGSLAFINRSTKDSKPIMGFAVIELFTSEGCSSCPPADELIAKIAKETDNENIYILAFHVDYWDRLGWKDQFSKLEFSKRQSKYSTWLGSSSVYTPQVVINGKKELVGSDEHALRTAIAKSLIAPSTAQIVLSEVKNQNDKIHLHYQINGDSENTSILVALIQKNATDKILRGENQGRELSHVQIVRDIKTIALTGQQNGETSFSIPSGTKGEMEIIALLQKNSSGEIIGATKYSAGF